MALLLVGAIGAAELTEEKLAQSQSDATSWLMYGKNYSGWRYSEIRQVDTTNASQLVPQWIFQTGVAGKFETTPLVYDRLMYVTAPENHAYALDLVTGRPMWHYHKPMPPGISLCCGQVNRGFAALGQKLFKVSLEATLLALDAKTGHVVWEVQIDDIKKGYSATVAPLVVKNLVLVGIAGAEYGTRGFIDAYDADSGKKMWRFWIVAEAGEPGGDSWPGGAWHRGGGSTWITGTYDPELNLVYWGTGNPGPDMNGDLRPGDNLYTCSLVALDASTGKLKWYYQFTPHDMHDWDSISDPVLVDIVVKGQKLKAVIQANRNGFFYALDRVTGKLLFAKPYTRVTWSSRIGTDGRPVLVPGQDPTELGNKVCPGTGGGHNWQATAYSRRTGLYYFTSTEACSVYYKTDQEFREGQVYQASIAGPIRTELAAGAILAMEHRRYQVEIRIGHSTNRWAVGHCWRLGICGGRRGLSYGARCVHGQTPLEFLYRWNRDLTAGDLFVGR
jgi:alcohol dehydrogenase (cytochrome c)